MLCGTAAAWAGENNQQKRERERASESEIERERERERVCVVCKREPAPSRRSLLGAASPRRTGAPRDRAGRRVVPYGYSSRFMDPINAQIHTSYKCGCKFILHKFINPIHTSYKCTSYKCTKRFIDPINGRTPAHFLFPQKSTCINWL
jgi:hypothetical protein